MEEEITFTEKGSWPVYFAAWQCQIFFYKCDKADNHRIETECSFPCDFSTPVTFKLSLLFVLHNTPHLIKISNHSSKNLKNQNWRQFILWKKCNLFERWYKVIESSRKYFNEWIIMFWIYRNKIFCQKCWELLHQLEMIAFTILEI